MAAPNDKFSTHLFSFSVVQNCWSASTSPFPLRLSSFSVVPNCWSASTMSFPLRLSSFSLFLNGWSTPQRTFFSVSSGFISKRVALCCGVDGRPNDEFNKTFSMSQARSIRFKWCYTNLPIRS